MSTRYGVPVICLPSAQRPLVPTAAEGFPAGTMWVETDTNLTFVLKYLGAVPSWIPVNGGVGNFPFIFMADNTGATDVSAQFTAQGIEASVSPSGELFVPTGTYQFTHVGRLVSNTKYELAPGTTLFNNQTFSGNEQANLLYTGRYLQGDIVPSSLIANLALAATPTQFVSIVVSVNGSVAPVKGNWLLLARFQTGDTADVNKQQLFSIEDVTGNGPWNVTLDRATAWPYLSGDYAGLLSAVPENITIDGNQGLLNFSGGGGDAPWQFILAYHIHVRDLRMEGEGATTGFAGISDIANYDVTIEDVYAHAFSSGFVASSTENLTLSRYRITGCLINDNGVGIQIWDGLWNRVLDCDSWGNVFGLNFTSNGGVLGGIGCLVSGGRFTGNSAAGIAVQKAQDLTIRDVDCRANTINGIAVDSPVTGLQVDGINVSDCINLPISCAASNSVWSRVTDIRTTLVVTDGLFFLGANNTRFQDSYIDISGISTGTVGISCYGEYRLSDTTIVLGAAAANFGVIVWTGTTFMDGCTFIGTPGAANAIQVQGGATLIIDDTTNLAGFAINIAPGGFSNIGPVGSLPTVLINNRSGTRGYAINARKPGEGAGSGTGCPVVQSANATWYSDFSGTPVTA